MAKRWACQELVAQAAALPVFDGRICLVRSSGGKRWVVPKGHVEPNATLTDTARTEAWEEAGLVGEIDDEPLGGFFYAKAGRTYEVVLFLMHVHDIAEDWPERRHRRRQWVRPPKAIRRLRPFGLRELVRVGMEQRWSDALTESLARPLGNDGSLARAG